jgi:hypothetical protein
MGWKSGIGTLVGEDTPTEKTKLFSRLLWSEARKPYPKATEAF